MTVAAPKNRASNMGQQSLRTFQTDIGARKHYGLVCTCEYADHSDLVAAGYAFRYTSKADAFDDYRNILWGICTFRAV